MRLAAIDIGTNSVHMIIARVRPDFSFEIVDREKEMVRLGAGGLDGRRLTPEAMGAALQALKKFARLAQSHQVDEILAVATSATREAENGGAFLRAIERRTGIRARIISGTEEARLIHLAAVYGVDTPKPAVVIDIGGGSVEITLGGKTDVAFARSFKIGVIRLTERFVDSDPISSRDERKMVRFIREEVSRYLDNLVEQGFDRVIGTSGTILSLGAVATAVDRGATSGWRRKASASCARWSSGWISRSACGCRRWIRGVPT
jgi:exopolyphosphatase / guanosine-5'-triphosphate,3'-diphosphate pyrophosphatase